MRAGELCVSCGENVMVTVLLLLICHSHIIILKKTVKDKFFYHQNVFLSIQIVQCLLGLFCTLFRHCNKIIKKVIIYIR